MQCAWISEDGIGCLSEIRKLPGLGLTIRCTNMSLMGATFPVGWNTCKMHVFPSEAFGATEL